MSAYLCLALKDGSSGTVIERNSGCMGSLHGLTAAHRDHELGKDAFHRVPFISGEVRDAVERVLTISGGRFMGRERSAGTPSGVVGQRAAAFTLVELLVLVAVLGFGALMLSPVLARTRVNSKTVTCMNNMKQLTAAWAMYAGENSDGLAINNDAYHPDPSGKFPVSWAGGVVNWNTTSANTNTLYLTDYRFSLLASYVAKSTSIFWCPTDTYLSPTQKAAGWSRRVRSVAMDAAVGDGSKYTGFPWSSTPVPFWWAKKMGELVAPGPGQCWVFIDEHPDSIDDCLFYIDPYATNGTGQFTELPANDHSGGCGVAFADGHAEIHRWVDPATLMPVTYIARGNVSVSNSKDLIWMASHTPHAP